MLLWLWLACSAAGGSGADDTAADTGENGGGDNGGDSSGGDTAGEDTSDDMLPAFKYLYTAIGDSCGSCHVSDYIGPFFVEGDHAATHDRLLNLRPIGDPQARYVVPGDAASSLLLQKLGDAPPFGESMPPADAEESPLDSSIVEALRVWVEGGAPL